jgi:hypothetical protein
MADYVFFEKRFLLLNLFHDMIQMEPHLLTEFIAVIVSFDNFGQFDKQSFPLLIDGIYGKGHGPDQRELAFGMPAVQSKRGHEEYIAVVVRVFYARIIADVNHVAPFHPSQFIIRMFMLLYIAWAGVYRIVKDLDPDFNAIQDDRFRLLQDAAHQVSEFYGFSDDVFILFNWHAADYSFSFERIQRNPFKSKTFSSHEHPVCCLRI